MDLCRSFFVTFKFDYISGVIIELTVFLYIHVVTSPEKTQHCPYLISDFFCQNCSKMATLPDQDVGAVVSLG